jgi:glycosyltransferase involved in cell wall biosynthesis
MNYGPNEAGAWWLARNVWPRVLRERPDARLVLLGASPTRRLRDLPRTDASIEVTGSVPAVQPFLWSSAVSAAPMLIARGLQNKVLEATAAGLPSVVTNAVFHGLPPAAQPACAVADSPEAFAEHLLRLLAAAPRERRAIAAQADLESLTWPRRLAGLESMLSTRSHARDSALAPMERAG